jgi:hypothetical protein
MTLQDAAALGQSLSPIATVVVVYLAYHFAMRQIRNQAKIDVYSTLMGTRNCLDGSSGPSPEKAQFNAALNRATAVFSDSSDVLQALENLRIHKDKDAAAIALLKTMHQDVNGKPLPDSAFQNFFKIA